MSIRKEPPQDNRDFRSAVCGKGCKKAERQATQCRREMFLRSSVPGAVSGKISDVSSQPAPDQKTANCIQISKIHDSPPERLSRKFYAFHSIRLRFMERLVQKSLRYYIPSFADCKFRNAHRKEVAYSEEGRQPAKNHVTLRVGLKM